MTGLLDVICCIIISSSFFSANFGVNSFESENLGNKKGSKQKLDEKEVGGQSVCLLRSLYSQKPKEM